MVLGNCVDQAIRASDPILATTCATASAVHEPQCSVETFADIQMEASAEGHGPSDCSEMGSEEHEKASVALDTRRRVVSAVRILPLHCAPVSLSEPGAAKAMKGGCMMTSQPFNRVRLLVPFQGSAAAPLRSTHQSVLSISQEAVDLGLVGAGSDGKQAVHGMLD